MYGTNLAPLRVPSGIPHHSSGIACDCIWPQAPDHCTHMLRTCFWRLNRIHQFVCLVVSSCFCCLSARCKDCKRFFLLGWSPWLPRGRALHSAQLDLSLLDCQTRLWDTIPHHDHLLKHPGYHFEVSRSILDRLEQRALLSASLQFFHHAIATQVSERE